MALGTISKVVGDSNRGQASAPIFVDAISFLGDGTYTAGGTLLFESLVQAVAGLEGRTVVAVIPQGLCGGYEPVYDAATDALILRVSATGVEAADSDYSGVTLNLLVISY